MVCNIHGGGVLSSRDHCSEDVEGDEACVDNGSKKVVAGARRRCSVLGAQKMVRRIDVVKDGNARLKT